MVREMKLKINRVMQMRLHHVTDHVGKDGSGYLAPPIIDGQGGDDQGLGDRPEDLRWQEKCQ